MGVNLALAFCYFCSLNAGRMRLITHIKASNLLSFGPDGLDLELRDLNVLIGANGSGKSNFLEIFEVLKSLPRSDEDSNNLRQIISRGGGKAEWIWKGNKESSLFYIESVVALLYARSFKHGIKINLSSGIEVSEEFIENMENDGLKEPD
ncbi:MAG: AAA family ATPase, partial [Saprospiraceae bacterium]